MVEMRITFRCVPSAISAERERGKRSNKRCETLQLLLLLEPKWLRWLSAPP